MGLMKQRMEWEEADLRMQIFLQDDLAPGSEALADFMQIHGRSDMFVAVDVRSERSREVVSAACQDPRPVTLILDSHADMEARSSLAGVPVRRLPAPLLSALAKVPGAWGQAARSWPLLSQMWHRRSSDDLAFMLLLAINDFVVPISSTQVNMGDLRSLACMCTKCREQIVACVQDPQCKAALDALSACGLNDQVCSYRVIASYESELLEQFSLCILQKHNCLRNSAEVPMVPDPPPLAAFRGELLSHDAAEDIFLGHLSSSLQQPFSWRVVCGKNPAYDFFPCQYQLFFRGKGGVMWYDPIFKVRTLQGTDVWRRRHYRVRRATTPGTFHFSVLDNGVTSKEYWRIMDCAEDLEWSVFYYSGAASAAGITYRGALICTPTGAWPTSEGSRERIGAALAACGIRVWEMSEVDNCDCADAPLSTPDYADIAPVALR